MTSNEGLFVPQPEGLSMVDATQHDLASKAAAVILGEVTNGRSYNQGVSLTDERETLQRGIEWILSGRTPRSFAVRQFPGSSDHDIACKLIVMDEFRDRMNLGRSGGLDG